MDNLNPYEEAFVQILLREFRDKNPPFGFVQKVKEATEEEVQQMVPGCTRRWLMKEVSRWKNKLLPKGAGAGNFRPTLHNLWVFCSVTGAAPEEILRGCGPGSENTPEGDIPHS